jgi:hypothetical protein
VAEHAGDLSELQRRVKDLEIVHAESGPAVNNLRLVLVERLQRLEKRVDIHFDTLSKRCARVEVEHDLHCDDDQAINWRAVAGDLFNTVQRLKECVEFDPMTTDIVCPHSIVDDPDCHCFDEVVLQPREKQILELQLDAFEKATSMKRPRGHIPATWMMNARLSVPESDADQT